MPQSVLSLTNSQYMPPMCGGGTATIWVSRETIFISGTCLFVDQRAQRQGRQGSKPADKGDVAEIQLVTEGAREVFREITVDQRDKSVRQVADHRDNANGQARDPQRDLAGVEDRPVQPAN